MKELHHQICLNHKVEKTVSEVSCKLIQDSFKIKRTVTVGQEYLLNWKQAPYYIKHVKEIGKVSRNLIHFALLLPEHNAGVLPH